MMLGFRHDPNAPMINYAWNGALFIGYMLVHYVMMKPGFKKLVAKSPEGSSGERRVYMVVAISTWVLMYAVHLPLPGAGYVLPEWAIFFGASAFLMAFLAFNEGNTFDLIKGFAGVPGYEQTHGASSVAPLQTKGSYASVRHPMYRGAVYMGLTSLLLHPNTAQLVWIAAIGLTFAAFIPIEERQLIKGRGDEYIRYMEVTRYRLLRGIW
jgi:protein-S-isoprenylcysteine O-methyltransferase Ste14